MTESQKAAMQMALDALETECAIYRENDPEDGAPEHIYEAIIALRAALEDIQTDCDLAQDGVCGRLECPICSFEPIAYYDPVEECVTDPMFESNEVKARLIPLVLQYPTDTRLTRSQNTLTVSLNNQKPICDMENE